MIILIPGIFVSLFAFQKQLPDAKEIVNKTNEKRRGETSMAELTISIIRPSWSRDMSVKTWSKGTENALILITAPVRDKGTVFLKRKNEIWNWVSSIDRNIKLPPSMMMQSWMGSDFTNDDLIKESSIVEDYTHKIVGDSVILGRACYKIELLPKEGAPVVWGKIYSWIDKSEYIELRSELYDEEGFLINEVVFSEIKELDGRELPSVMEYIPVDKEGHKTVMRYHTVDYDIPLEESFFSLQNMKRVQ
ncbi:outer membrane lipoprotein-sorting protein [Catalinimonas alkaloidigena]|uniref:outer membrane lipoprotein-sorting protein n=1 Tax=Catalinimonas alkaloidigena TaxID=1075417 RepID=UPI002405762B|nr:outer membrane lipoprotein-sorting protein [Catalinimonas alkaloidigena]